MKFSSKYSRYLPAVAAGLVMVAVADGALAASAAGYQEFDSVSQRFENWLQGGYGKAAALAGAGIGTAIAAITKQLLPTLVGVGIAVMVPITMSVINSSFSAVI